MIFTSDGQLHEVEEKREAIIDALRYFQMIE